MPDIAPGASGAVAVAQVGSGPGTTGDWQILQGPSYAIPVATNLATNGWSVVPSNSTSPTSCAVGVPSGAPVAAMRLYYLGGAGGGEGGYKRNYSGNFNVAASLQVPGPPTNCAAVPSFVTPGDASNDVKCTVTWGAPTSGGAVASFSLYRNGALLAAGLTALSYVDLAVVNNLSCVYHVVAVNAAGSSAGSNQGKAKCPTVPPSGLVANMVGAAAEVAWTAPSGAVAYDVEMSPGDPLAFGVIASALAATSYSHGARLPGIIYYYRTKAHNTEAGFNTIASKVSNLDCCLYLAAPAVVSEWGLERNDNTKPRSRHLRIIRITAPAPASDTGFDSPVCAAGVACPAGGVWLPGIGSTSMAPLTGIMSGTMTEEPLTPEGGRSDYFDMTGGELQAYFKVTIGAAAGLPAKVIVSECSTFTIPPYVTGRRTYYDPATKTLINERSPTRDGLGTLWLKIRGTRRDWRHPNGRLYRDLPKRPEHD